MGVVLALSAEIEAGGSLTINESRVCPSQCLTAAVLIQILVEVARKYSSGSEGAAVVGMSHEK